MVNDQHVGEILFERQGSLVFGRFRAMANPCVFIVEHDDTVAVQEAMLKMANEAWRIEQTYSRYIPNSVLGKINAFKGKPLSIDPETYHLLQLSDVLWQESQGVFDISSGVFRKIWHFKDQQKIPSKKEVESVLKDVGWKRVKFDQQQITLPTGMQIDFGGIGKEYAADRCLALAPDTLGNAVLVNLGGDVVAKGPREKNKPWNVGIETKQGDGQVWKELPLTSGAFATSGDVYKSLLCNGKRYGHIINALTGFPVTGSPRTVTVAAPNCTEAGMLSTLAMLQGENAESFLQQQGRPYWVQR